MTPHLVEELYAYVQERCLWQFVSRAWDREENIDGVLSTTCDLLCGDPPKRTTQMEALFYADATILVADIRSRFPVIAALPPAELREVFRALKEQVTEITITKSRNRELTQKLY